MPALSLALLGRGTSANDATGDTARDGALKLNRNARLLEALAKGAVISATTTAQPASPSVGDLYIIPSGKTGTDWSAMTNGSLALYAENDGANSWYEIAPQEGLLVFVRDVDTLLSYTGTAWAGAAVQGPATHGANTFPRWGAENSKTLVARSASEFRGDLGLYAAAGTWSSTQTFAAATGIIVASALPTLRLYETDAAADEKNYSFEVSGGYFILRARDDAAANPVHVIVIQRSGTSIVEIEMNAPMFDFNGALDVSGSGKFGGVLLAPNGSVSAPAYSFSGDSNTGLYNIAADNIGLSLGGTKYVDFAVAKTAFAHPIEAPTAKARIPASSETSGTLTAAASANTRVPCAGNVTLPSSGMTDGDCILIDPRGTARTITRPGGHTMYVAGTNTATATTGAHNIAVAMYHGASKWTLQGAVT
ncbi:MAG: DUF2793 domain-containing protein [Hyphomonadaceae bacterium]|nr:DUF2793 domain-containing protein [Hyphomonadaceae bacterium]